MPTSVPGHVIIIIFKISSFQVPLKLKNPGLLANNIFFLLALKGELKGFFFGFGFSFLLSIKRIFFNHQSQCMSIMPVIKSFLSFFFHLFFFFNYSLAHIWPSGLNGEYDVLPYIFFRRFSFSLRRTCIIEQVFPQSSSWSLAFFSFSAKNSFVCQSMNKKIIKKLFKILTCNSFVMAFALSLVFSRLSLEILLKFLRPEAIFGN